MSRVVIIRCALLCTIAGGCSSDGSDGGAEAHSFGIQAVVISRRASNARRIRTVRRSSVRQDTRRACCRYLRAYIGR